jgi:hypothetical protein
MHDPAVPNRVAGLKPRTHYRGDMWLLVLLVVLLLAAIGLSTGAG